LIKKIKRNRKMPTEKEILDQFREGWVQLKMILLPKKLGIWFLNIFPRRGVWE
jgi:hypothetical protein